jgi:hypothetical protein
MSDLTTFIKLSNLISLSRLIDSEFAESGEVNRGATPSIPAFCKTFFSSCVWFISPHNNRSALL